MKEYEQKSVTKYYLIEEYTEYDDRPGGSSWKAYDVQSFSTAEQLEKAILQGSKHGGKLIPTKGLELKLQLIDEELEKHRADHGVIS